MSGLVSRLQSWWSARQRALLPALLAEAAPLDLRIVGRTLLQAALVGVAAGLAGAAFFAGLEYVQHLLLEQGAGYQPLRAHGELVAHTGEPTAFRPWLLIFLPALGGLGCGLFIRMVPEIRGGGGDAMIEAFHRRNGLIRRRVIWLKPLASLCTLGSGGSGGREGPTMQIGGALGSLVARVLRVSARERRILLVAGVAAGMSAVFRTPLGAAILAVEVLYRDGFESDALIPSVLASVVAYSVVISIFGESTLFAHADGFPFIPVHLPLYGLLAVMAAALGALFVSVLRRTQRLFARLPGPAWTRPALGGLALGVLCTPIILEVGRQIGANGQGLGILGGGYGAVQMAITGSRWLPEGWRAVELLALLSFGKLLSSSLTIGSGGSAGDFAPSLAIGGLFGGAFGRAAQLLLADPRIDPGAFALVGMGVFYGGIAHAPLSALVMVCEMAGNYDLLVPLMLALGISYVALRKTALYESQLGTQQESPVHRDALLLELFRSIHVADLLDPRRSHVSFDPGTPATEVLRAVGEAADQDVFPVLDASGALVGLVTAPAVRVLAMEREDTAWTVAADLMQPVVSVGPDDDLRRATETLLSNGLRAIPVVDHGGRFIGFLDEDDVANAYIGAASRAGASPGSRSSIARDPEA